MTGQGDPRVVSVGGEGAWLPITLMRGELISAFIKRAESSALGAAHNLAAYVERNVEAGMDPMIALRHWLAGFDEDLNTGGVAFQALANDVVAETDRLWFAPPEEPAAADHETPKD